MNINRHAFTLRAFSLHVNDMLVFYLCCKFLVIFHPVGVWARPPPTVSRKAFGMADPNSNITWTTSSEGMTLRTPARAVQERVQSLRHLRCSLRCSPIRFNDPVRDISVYIEIRSETPKLNGLSS